MNATMLGKLLVYMNLVFSLVLAALALGVATNRIEWAGSATPGENEGEDAHKRAEIQQYQENLLRFRARWKGEQETLAALEKKRPENLKWYAEQLHIAVTGTDKAGKEVANPIKDLEYEKDGRLKLDKDQRPALVDHPDKRLVAQKIIAKQVEDKEDEIKAAIKEVHMLIKQQEELTLKLRGDPGKQKGLIALLEEAQLAQKNSVEELLVAKREAINGRVASESLLKRNRELTRRIAELRNIGVAANQP